MAEPGAVAMRPLSLGSPNPARENVASDCSDEIPPRPYSHEPIALQGTLMRLTAFARAIGSSSYWRREGWKTTIATLVGTGGFAIACVALWSTITAANDGRKAEILAEWTAKKDFLEFCQAVSESNFPYRR